MWAPTCSLACSLVCSYMPSGEGILANRTCGVGDQSTLVRDSFAGILKECDPSTFSLLSPQIHCANGFYGISSRHVTVEIVWGIESTWEFLTSGLVGLGHKPHADFPALWFWPITYLQALVLICTWKLTVPFITTSQN